MRLVVLGGGESGVGAAILGKKLGMEVFLSDSGNITEHYAEMLRSHEIPYESGCHTESAIISADEVVKSPGIPPTAPIVNKIASKNIPIISEIEFAGRYTDAKMVCITARDSNTTTR